VNYDRDDIKKKVTILEYLRTCGVELKPFGGKGELRFRCFGDHEDNRPSCDLNVEMNVFTCRSCGAGGDIFSLIELKERVDFKGAIQHLAEFIGGDFVAQNVSGPLKVESNVEPLFFRLPIPADCIFPVAGQSIQVYNNGIKTVFPAAVHPYYADGGSSHFILRTIKKDGGKGFIPLFWGKVGGERPYEGWIAKDLRSADEPRVLYGLQRLNADDHKTIVIVEGEKCVDFFYEHYSVHEDSYVFISWSNGSSAISKTDWSPIEGRKVIFWADNDAPGRKAQKWFLKEVDANWIMIVDETKLPVKGDIADLPPNQEGMELMLSYLVDAEEVKRSIEGWEAELDRFENGKIRGGINNISLFLTNHPDFKGAIRYDLTYDRIFIDRNPGMLVDISDPYPRPLTSIDVIHIWRWFDSEKIQTKKATVIDAIDAVAADHQHDSCQEYIDCLSWDKVERIDDFFEKHLHVKPIEGYTKMVSRKFWLSLLSRCIDPGCKMDNYFILEGKGGVKKSTFLETICPKWFKDGLPSIRGDEFKNTVRDGCRLVEDDELQLLQGVSSATAKGFITQRMDEYRRKYDINTTKTKRQYMIVGTTNEIGQRYLKDKSTGNRRYLPVHICPNGEQVDLFGVEFVLDQLWAEAAFKTRRYFKDVKEGANPVRCADKHWLDEQELVIASVQQRLRTDLGEFVEELLVKLNDEHLFKHACHNGLKMTDIFIGLIGRYPSRKTKQCKDALIECGFEYEERTTKDGLKKPALWKLKR